MDDNQYVALKEQVDELTTKLEKMTKLHGYQAAAQTKVIEAARKYALMTSFGQFIQNESIVSVSPGDRVFCERKFAEELLAASISMFIEDGLAGAGNR